MRAGKGPEKIEIDADFTMFIVAEPFRRRPVMPLGDGGSGKAEGQNGDAQDYV